MYLHEIQLVQCSLALINTQVEAFSTLFYKRLFTQSPNLRPLFSSDLRRQGLTLMHMLTVIVNGLDQPQLVIQGVKRLGERHGRYGAEAEHFHVMGEALFWTLEQTLGSAYTPMMATAWQEAYFLIAGLMKEAMAGGGMKQ